METIKQAAQAYEPQVTLNISELNKIPINLELNERDGKTNEGKDFTYKFATIDGKDYRVPVSVLGGIKAILEKKPDLEFISVLKQGERKGTTYTVIPYQGD